MFARALRLLDTRCTRTSSVFSLVGHLQYCQDVRCVHQCSYASIQWRPWLGPMRRPVLFPRCCHPRDGMNGLCSVCCVQNIPNMCWSAVVPEASLRSLCGILREQITFCATSACLLNIDMSCHLYLDLDFRGKQRLHVDSWC